MPAVCTFERQVRIAAQVTLREVDRRVRIAAQVTVREPADMGALDSPLTRPGSILGTPAYMAPEQLAGEHADARTDQFSFCVSAWHALTGSRPFRGTAVRGLVDGLPLPTVATIPRRIRAALLRGLAHDPAQRWSSMEQLLKALQPARRRGLPVAIACAGTLATLLISGAAPASSPAAEPSYIERFDHEAVDAEIDAHVRPSIAQLFAAREVLWQLACHGDVCRLDVAHRDDFAFDWIMPLQQRGPSLGVTGGILEEVPSPRGMVSRRMWFEVKPDEVDALARIEHVAAGIRP